MRKYLPIEEMKGGREYRGHCRNATIAKWDSSTRTFRYFRKKFDMEFMEDIHHEDDPNGFDTFKPYSLVMNEEEFLAYLKETFGLEDCKDFDDMKKGIEDFLDASIDGGLTAKNMDPRRFSAVN